RVTSTPATTIVPDVGASSPATSPSSVDLPLPEGPATATASPASTSSETPSSTLSVRPPLGRRRVRSRIETSILPILHSEREAPPRAAGRPPPARRVAGGRRRPRHRRARRQPDGRARRLARGGVPGGARGAPATRGLRVPRDPRRRQ